MRKVLLAGLIAGVVAVVSTAFAEDEAKAVFKIGAGVLYNDKIPVGKKTYSSGHVALDLNAGPHFALSPFVEGYKKGKWSSSAGLDFIIKSNGERVRPYFGVGGGVFHIPTIYKGAIDALVGLDIKASDHVSIFLEPRYIWAASSIMSGAAAHAGLAFSLGSAGDKDSDGDGLFNRQEKQIGTDKKNPDTDGDGLKDGEEVNTYHTDPLKADTAGDGLNDGAEVREYKTDPNKADTDGDGLKDGEEISRYKTNPLKPDTDNDGLNDGEEVNRYKTDPLKADTDGGSVNDGTEVTRGTDPLNPADDIAKKPETYKVEVGKAIVLEGVVFATGKADITPASAEILEKAFQTLQQNPDITVEIRGYTDTVGNRPYNMRLSQKRADAVRTFLVQKGIAATRITAKGFGPDNPVASNKTPKGRQQNRRIEFYRTR